MPKEKISLKEQEKIKSLFNEGQSIRAISRELSLSPSTIHKYTKEIEVGRAKEKEVKPAKPSRAIREVGAKPEQILARPSKIEGKTLKCPNCGYEWRTRSKLGWVTCPSCMRKVRVNKTTQI
jgi:IS30 family transposase